MIQPGTPLLIVDVQKGFSDPHWGARNNPRAEDNIAGLLAAWRSARLPVIHVRHDSTSLTSPLHPSRPGNALRDDVAPMANERLIAKSANSAFIGTNLREHLEALGAKSLVIVGLTTPHCISTTVRMAGNFGFEVQVPEDATAAFELRGHDGARISPADVHYHALAALSGEFAAITATQPVLEQLRRV
jgi:nicotinamidase-related amidase